MRTAAMVLWCSFLVASAGTMFCFAFVDPAPLGNALLTFGLEAGRMTLYSLGFLFFWALCAASGALTLWMSRPQ